MEEMQRKAYRRKLFNDQANKLLCRYPDMRDEVTWRMVHLNSKWETLEQAITPCKSNPNQLDMCAGNTGCSTSAFLKDPFFWDVMLCLFAAVWIPNLHSYRNLKHLN